MKVSKFLLATQNSGKLAELRLYLSSLTDSYPMVGLDTLPEKLPSPEETGSQFSDNACLKALYYSRYCDPETCVIAEDSGLSVEALAGAPGVFSARYAGVQASDSDNISKLLKELQGQENRKAHFCTVIALACNQTIITTFTGTVEGLIASEPKGDKGFGYDPVFYYPPLRKCFAELTAEEKNQVSHRSKAMLALSHFIRQMIHSTR